MSDKTNISWTDATLNPIYGCSRISKGCERCYAEEVVASLPRKFKGKNDKAFEFFSDLTKETPNGPRWTGVIKVHRGHLVQPLRWHQPKRIFLNSLSDLFHENLSRESIVEVFAYMAVAHWHTFQVLTKRPRRMLDLLKDPNFESDVCFVASAINANCQHEKHPKLNKRHPGIKWPLPGVWLGVSTENQATADERIPLLLRTPAAVRFLSCEPLLGELNLEKYLYVPTHCNDCGSTENYYDPNPENLPPLDPKHPTCSFGAVMTGEPGAVRCRSCKSLNVDELAPVSWIIAGGESGPNFRPMKQEWAVSLRDQCVAAHTAYFYKQDSDRKSGQRPYLVENGKAYQWHQFPGQLTEPVEVEI